MSEVANIFQKLERFIKKYYTNELIKGSILFVSFGMLYFLLTLSLEYFFWLGKLWRMLLFWIFLLIEAGLLGWFVARPLLAFFKLKKGLDHEQAAKIIGRHFSEVSDKLINLLQLSSVSDKDELLIAGIEQKAHELSPVPFQLAVNFNSNRKYLRYATLPLLIVLAIWLSGKLDFFDSYRRVVNYQTAYAPPPPFEYIILNNKLSTVQNEDFQLNVKVAGAVLPSDITIVLDNQTYLLKQTGIDTYTYSFFKPQEDINFYLTSNGYDSKEYTLKTINAPSMLQVKMVLDYPGYTQKMDETIVNAGNISVPEGTNVTWEIDTKATSNILYANRQDSIPFSGSGDLFVLEKKILNSSRYSLISSNSSLRFHEKLDYQIEVVKDGYPRIQVKQWIDSINPQNVFFIGETTDDYGIKAIRMAYYPSSNKTQVKYLSLPVKDVALSRFSIAFPDTLSLIPGQTYDLFFEVTDNDGIHGSKKTVSEIFSFAKLTQTEEAAQSLDKQKEMMDKINKTSRVLDRVDKQLEEINKLQKTKSQLSWNEQQQLKNLIERQKQQEQMMKSFSEDLLKNIQNNKGENNTMQEALKERLESNKQEAEQNEKLMEELQRITDKLSQTELNERIEKLSNQSKSRKKSLQQLLELTKRFYVSQKLQNLTDQLDQLADKQEKLSEKADDNQSNTDNQKNLNLEFDDFKRQLEELMEENSNLKKPMQIERDQITEKQITKEQQQALKSLSESKPGDAKTQQKNAAGKMRGLSKAMQQEMASAQGDQLQEDVDVLRQILDNLVSFSFMQEALFDKISNANKNAKSLSAGIKEQYALRENFQHIDDSLFSLSLRRPEFSEMINKEIQNVYENIDKSLYQLSEYEEHRASSSQQYTLTSTNKLADFLSDILDNMQEQLSSSSSSSGNGFQLPDIIQQQQSINDAMQKKMGEQKGQQDGEGKEGEDGEKEGGDKKGDKGGTQGNKKGQSSNQGGEGDSELDYEGIMEIYKQQQTLKFQLENLIKREGLAPPNTNLLKQAEQIEQELLLKGFNNETLSKMINFKHQLLKLEEAVNQQDNDKKRKAETNTKDFTPVNVIPLELQQYFRELEILNRQALPLRPIYKNRVNRYFTGANDTIQQ